MIVDAEVEISNLKVISDGLRINYAARPVVLDGQRGAGIVRW